ncbi:MAG: TCP-1/cpn60 chaperonin family protein, partial [Candidatus Paceibacterota bacterium]
LNAIVASGNTSVLVVALDVEGEALASLVMNHQRKALRVACVQAPYTGQRQKDFLKDLAILTGATVVSEEAGMKLDSATAAVLGKAEKVIIDMNETTVVNGGGDRAEIDERVASLRELLGTKESDHDKKIVQTRIAGLDGGIAVIRIGALSDVELKKRRDKIEDAIHSVKLALEEGVVPGGGSPFAKIATRIEDPIFRKALVAPFERMAFNAGMFDHRGIIARLFKMKSTVYDALFDVWNGDDNEGYNFKTRTFCDLVESKIIDPFKVERIALESAVSFVAQVITTDEVMLEEKAKPKDE